jgi:hypothetical protein
LIASLAQIPEAAVGFCQILFQPVCPNHDWHRNVQALLNLEYTLQLMSGNVFAPRQLPQQEPSFALMAALLPFGSLFLHGGRSLGRVTEKEYAQVLSPGQVREMFMLGLTYRPGFLLNSSELSGLVHIPPTSIFECRRIEIKPLETLSVMSDELSTGCRIGTCDCAGVPQAVCIPEHVRFCSVHYIGRMGSGKSTLFENNTDQDIREYKGLAVLDPHGDLIEKLLRLIPAAHAARTIHFNPADPEYVPLWNPLQCTGVEDRGRIADDLVAAIRNVVEARKYKVGLTLAHQYMSQFTTRKRDALSSVGATVIFNVDTKDASHLRKDLQDKVEVNDLISLEKGEAVARIGTEIVRFKTLKPIEVPEKHVRDQIIAGK